MQRGLAVAAAAAAALAVALLAGGAGESAREHRTVEGIATAVGWAENPPLAGFPNAVEITLTQGGADGGSNSVTGASLAVEVSFGDGEEAAQSPSMPLRPAFELPGVYRAPLIPTEPGPYAFRVTGQIRAGLEIDETYQSGDRGFADVLPAEGLEFPPGAPSRDQLAEQARHLEQQVLTLAAALDDANRTARIAQTIAVGGIGAALLAAALALALGLRRHPPSPTPPRIGSDAGIPEESSPRGG